MIQINQVSKSFKGLKAVDDLSLEVKAGEVYGLLGPNGAGKSTTMNMLLGFLRPDKGSTAIAGIDVVSQTQKARRKIGYIAENVSLYPHLTGLENLDYFCRLSRLYLSRSELSIILEECGLAEESHHRYTSTYSKGMRQKVGIAIAYARSAEVYLLDEPSSGLDPQASNELTQLIRKLSDKGASILMASHDLFRVRESCKRIGILRHGTLVKEMESDTVNPQQLEEIYLNYMRK